MARAVAPPDGRVGGFTAAMLVLGTLIVGVAAPVALLLGLHRAGHDPGQILYLAALAAVLANAAVELLAGLGALGSGPTPTAPRRPYPPATAIILAGDDPVQNADAAHAFLAVPYLHPLQVILVGETLPGEEAVDSPRVTMVPAAGTRWDLLRAALPAVSGEFVGIFDANERPQRSGFAAAWLWLSRGSDAVVGHTLYPDRRSSWAGRLAAVSGETAIALPCGIAAPWDVGEPWGDGNIYLLTSAARTLAATEEEPSIPATDRRLVAYRPSGLSWRGWLAELYRRERAWLSLPVWYAWRTVAATRGWRRVLFATLFWHPIWVWLAPLTPIAIGWQLWRYHAALTPARWVPLLILAVLYVVAGPLLRTLFAFTLAAAPVRQPRWFLSYLGASMLFLAGLEHTVARALQLHMVFGRPPRTRNRAVPLPAAEETDTTAEPAPMENGATAPGGVTDLAEAEILAARLEKLRAADVRLRERLVTLEAEVERYERMRGLIEQAAGPEDVAELEQALGTLAGGDQSILVLATVSRRAGSLARIVQVFERLPALLDLNGHADGA